MEEMIYTITLTGFSFPDQLKGNKANFRFLATLRFINSKGDPSTLSVILPNAVEYWECDPDHVKKSNFVREPKESHADVEEKEFESRFNMEKVGTWNNLVFQVQAKRLEAIQFKVFNVNRKDGWEKLLPFLKVIPGVFAGPLGPALGIAKAATSTVLEQVSKDDSMLFQGHVLLSQPTGTSTYSERIRERGEDQQGIYTIDLQIERTSGVE